MPHDNRSGAKEGQDRPGAVADIVKRLAAAKRSMSPQCRFFVLARAAMAACSGSKGRTYAKPPKRLLEMLRFWRGRIPFRGQIIHWRHSS
jgi:hypothetical protein